MEPRRLIIGAPFGNWLSWPGCINTLGTFTLERRGGALYRLWRCLLTLRHRGDGWVNRLGLPNPGVDSIPYGDYRGRIISVKGFGEGEWLRLIMELCWCNAAAIEFNVSCPNVAHKPDVSEISAGLRWARAYGFEVVVKLSPVGAMEMAKVLVDAGVGAFHCCNTLPVKQGGLSGKALKPYSLRAVEAVKKLGVFVIGGGGVDCPADVKDYVDAGADSVSVASMLLNPLNWYRVPAIREALCGRN